ncbi:MAG: PHP domain-containing protein, partial [Actinomycetota bacterium]
MGFDSSHEVPWPQLERLLSNWDAPSPKATGRNQTNTGEAGGHAFHAPLGSDAPVYKPPPVPYDGLQWRPGKVPYAELHCHSNFSFLDGASSPEELAREATLLGLEALALTDHDGMYGVVRFAEVAKEIGLRTVFGAELSFDLPKPQSGEPDPCGHHLLVLARDPEGYARLCRLISEAQLAGKQKGKPVYDLARLAELHGGHWLMLTGCRKGSVPKALAEGGPEAAERALNELIDVFGKGNVAIELWDHGFPTDSARNDALAELAAKTGVDLIATNNVHYASPERWQLANAIAAVRARRSLDEIEGWLPPAPTARIRSGEEMAKVFERYPGAVQR